MSTENQHHLQAPECFSLIADRHRTGLVSDSCALGTFGDVRKFNTRANLSAGTFHGQIGAQQLTSENEAPRTFPIPGYAGRGHVGVPLAGLGGLGAAMVGRLCKDRSCGSACGNAVDAVGQWQCAVLCAGDAHAVPGGHDVGRIAADVDLGGRGVASGRVSSTDVEHDPAVIDEEGSSSSGRPPRADGRRSVAYPVHFGEDLANVAAGRQQAS